MTCPHHWLIEDAKGLLSKGVCRICGATRIFENYPPPTDQYRNYSEATNCAPFSVRSARAPKASGAYYDGI